MPLFIEVNTIGNPSKQLLVNVDSIKWISQGEGMDGARLFLCDKEFEVLLKELVPGDRAGVTQIQLVAASPDGRTLAYSYQQALYELYVVEGLK